MDRRRISVRNEGDRTIQTIPVELADTFLAIARKHAELLRDASNPKPKGAVLPVAERLESSLVALLFVAASIEARAHEAAFDVMSDDERRRFSELKGKDFAAKLGGVEVKGYSKLRWKWWFLLCRREAAVDFLNDPLLNEIETVYRTRSRLIHYEANEKNAVTAEEPGRPPVADGSHVHIQLPDGRSVSLHAGEFGELLSAATASRHIATAEAVFRRWADASTRKSPAP